MTDSKKIYAEAQKVGIKKSSIIPSERINVEKFEKMNDSFDQKFEKINKLLDQNSDSKREATRSLVRKMDRRLLPILCVMYLVGYLDRSNISNAKLAGLVTDLHMSALEYQWTLSSFFFSYVIFEIPSNIIMRRWRASVWFGLITLLWGAIACAMAAVKNFTGLVICRVLLGAFEAGFFPGVVYFMSLWYTRKEYGFRIGFFWSFSSLAGAFGGLVAYGISQIPNDRLKTWQWLFIIEGLPTILLATFSMWYLPNSPETAKFLKDDERAFAISRLAQDAGASNDHSWSWAQVESVFKDYKTYVYMLIYITGTIALQGVTLFLPSIIADMGTWSKAIAQLLTAPPYALAFVFTLLVSWSSDRLFQRAYFLIVINFFGMTGLLLLMFLPSGNIAGNYVAACIVIISLNANVAVKIAWFNNNYGGLTRRAVASAAITSIGNIGGAIGGQIYYDPPKYFAGNTISFACIVFQTILVITLRVLFAYENNRRSKLNDEQKELEILKYGGPELVGDRHYSFRYVL